MPGLSKGQEVGVIVDALVNLRKEPYEKRRRREWKDEDQRYMNQLADYLEHLNIEVCTLHD